MQNLAYIRDHRCYCRSRNSCFLLPDVYKLFIDSCFVMTFTTHTTQALTANFKSLFGNCGVSCTAMGDKRTDNRLRNYLPIANQVYTALTMANK